MMNYFSSVKKLTFDKQGLFSITANNLTNIRIFIIVAIWPLVIRLGFSHIYFKLDLIYSSTRFSFWVNNILDLVSLHEVFIQKVYETKLGNFCSVIFDLGSGTGDSAIFFSLLYPESKIYAFEPQPDNFKKLLKNTTGFSNIKIFPWAVSKKNGIANFYIHPNSSLSSSLTQRVPLQKIIKVKTITLDSVIETQKIKEIDIIKFDIEGAEKEIFQQQFRGKKIKPHFLIGEIHFDLMKISRSAFKKFLPGFNLFFTKINDKRSYLFGIKKEKLK